MILQYHQGPYLQRGRGVGSVLSALFRRVTPALKMMGRQVAGSKVVRDIGGTLLNSAVQGGLNFAADALNGENLKESAATSVTTAKRELAKTIRRSIPAKVRLPSAGAAKRKTSRPVRPPAKRARTVFDEATDEDGDDDDDGGGDGSGGN
jgi:hypothetical protein